MGYEWIWYVGESCSRFCETVPPAASFSNFDINHFIWHYSMWFRRLFKLKDLETRLWSTSSVVLLTCLCNSGYSCLPTLQLYPTKSHKTLLTSAQQITSDCWPVLAPKMWWSPFNLPPCLRVWSPFSSSPPEWCKLRTHTAAAVCCK